MKQQCVDDHGGRVIECIKATVKRVLDHGGTPDTAVQTALAAAALLREVSHA